MTFNPFIQPGEVTSAVLAIVFLVLIYRTRRGRPTDAARER